MEESILDKYFKEEDAKPAATALIEPEIIPPQYLPPQAKSSSNIYKIDYKHLKLNQREFIKLYLEPLDMGVEEEGSDTLSVASKPKKNEPEPKPKPTTILSICKKLSISLTLPFMWAERDRAFKLAFDTAREIRGQVYNELAKAQLVSNYISGKEVSLIFYLKNHLPMEYRDDSILSQVYLKHQTLNVNFIKTEYAGVDTQELLSKAQEITCRIEGLRSGRGGAKLREP